MVAHCAPGSAGSSEGGAWGAEQLQQREGRDAVIALCSHAAAWEWCARPPPPGKAPCWQGPRCLCPGTRLCLPKMPSPPPSAPPHRPSGGVSSCIGRVAQAWVRWAKQEVGRLWWWGSMKSRHPELGRAQGAELGTVGALGLCHGVGGASLRDLGQLIPLQTSRPHLARLPRSARRCRRRHLAVLVMDGG